MARLGEGDARWIVEHRDDGRNVNNWHWAEKDVSAWAKRRLRELLQNMSVKNHHSEAEITSLSKIDGDATLYNRKGKLKCVFDLNVVADWEGHAVGGDADATKGKATFEIFDDDPEVTITVDKASSGTHRQMVAQLMASEGKRAIIKRLATFLSEVRDTQVDNLKALASDEVGATARIKTPAEFTVEETIPKAPQNQRTVINSSSSVRPSKKSSNTLEDLTIDEQFNASVSDIFAALTDARRLSGFTMQSAQFDARPGGFFSLYNGTVTGVTTALTNASFIKQSWRMQKWPAQHHSEVEITLEDVDGHTMLHLRQRKIPREFRGETEEFWRVQMLQRMKVVLGYGSARGF